MSIFPTACECTEPGWCERHQRFKDRTYFEYCRRLAAWFQLWERGEGPSAQALVLNVERKPCRHFGEELGRQECPTCEGHVELKIFACALHRECALSPYAVAVRVCSACLDYEPRP